VGAISACGTINVKEQTMLSAPTWQTLTEPPAKDSLNDVELTKMTLVGEDATAKSAIKLLGAKGSSISLIATDGTELFGAQDSAMRTFVKQTMEMTSTPNGKQSLAEDKDLPGLSKSDVIAFVKSMIKESLGRYALTEIQTMNPKDKKLSFKELLFRYVAAYYNGNFIDRYGSKHTRVKPSLTVTNEAITGLESVMFEAFGDWQIINRQLKVPILYTGRPNSPKFVVLDDKDKDHVRFFVISRGLMAVPIEAELSSDQVCHGNHVFGISVAPCPCLG